MGKALAVSVIANSLLFLGLSFADESLLPEDHGYILIRVELTTRERVRLLEMSNTETNDVVKLRTESFQRAGSNAWMALVAMPRGRYFWSEYEATYGIDPSETQAFPLRHIRRTPRTASDTFEIVPGVINYVGDWKMRVVSSQRYRLDPIIDYDVATLTRFVERYPERANKYEIYMLIMGKKAISLDELAKIMEEHTE
ncbi:MAG: hypothetical protein IIA07_11080 [Proteobacteria bacterium]|nr:hypothetical protein [Pseudomonadota bacterium]